ncbi:DNA topoisomerase [Leucoagaricus gongylophorus]
MTAPKPTVASSSYASSSISRSLPPSSTAVHSSTRPNITSRGVLCECGIPALVRTNKSGINSIGKNFYICPKDSCGFWKWVDDVESSVSATSSNVIVPAKRTYTQTNSDPTEPTRICKCGVIGIMLTVQKEGVNQGRKFWKCRKTQNEGNCSFFEWDDELSRPPGGTGGGARKCYNVSAWLCVDYQ